MAGFKKKTLKEVQESIVNDYITRLSKDKDVTGVLLPKSVVRSLAWAVAGVTVPMWNFLSWTYMQILPQTCGVSILKLWGSLVGVEYKAGTNTTLQVSMSGLTAPSIVAGTLWKSLKNGVVYKSVATAYPVDGNVTFSVEALSSGAVGNLEAGDELNIVNPFDGIPDLAMVVSQLVVGSVDEDVEVYRKRVLLKFKQKPQGGSPVDYYLWGTEVPGIVDVIPYVFETGTNVLYLVSDGSGKNRVPTGKLLPNPFPEWENGDIKIISGSGQFYQVAMAINSSGDLKNDRRPMGAVVELRECNFTGFRVEIVGLSPCTNEMIAKISNAITEYLDVKRPENLAVGYKKSDATINANMINGLIQNAINSESGSTTSFSLKNNEGKEINEAILGLGCLAYLEKLTINGVDVVL